MADKPTRRCGSMPHENGSIRWRVWAPRADHVDLVLIDGDSRRVHGMEQEGQGFFTRAEANVSEGQRYFYSLKGGSDRPDPCSLWQPEGVAGPSAVIRPDRFTWADQEWKGVAREDLVFYELHVGTFTPEGTFEAIIPRLAALRDLGISAVELMPVGQFPGRRNWGYDGVLPYAVQDSYGGPHGLKKLVEACHAQGLALFLDVVYNHFGPEGNYMNEFGPYFTDRYRTPWGTAVNYDGPGCDAVRDYVLDNARMWLDEFHLDGLRLDAVHAIFDLGARHLLLAMQEIAEQVGERRGFPAHFVAESDLNDPRLMRPPEKGGYGLAAQWSDDFHHAVHAYLTDEKHGYYADYGEADHLASVLERPYLFAWDYSPNRGRKHGAPPDDLTGDRFVVCLQNHDQVGNRATGDRLTTLLTFPAKRLAASLLLLSPHLPLLFMGEEYGEENPFPFFCSFGDPQLVQAVREGRRREFADFSEQGEVPDPQAESTFASARLSWSWPDGGDRAGLRRLHQDLLAARREWPALRDFTKRQARLTQNDLTAPVLEFVRGDYNAGTAVVSIFNLSSERLSLPNVENHPPMVLFRSESMRYGGSVEEGGDAAQLLPYECVVFGPASWRKLG